MVEKTDMLRKEHSLLGLKQSDRLIINNTKGCSDRYLRRQIADRLNINMAIAEVWVYEKGKKRLIFKDGKFYKDNREV